MERSQTELMTDAVYTAPSLTTAQQQTLTRLRNRWQFVERIHRLPCEDAIAVHCGNDGSEPGHCKYSVWYCIETDGHAHT